MDFTDAQRAQLAKDGHAMADGSYPIRNTADLARAILALGRANNPAAAKAWIIRRARELNATDTLPKAWNITS